MLRGSWALVSCLDPCKLPLKTEIFPPAIYFVTSSKVRASYGQNIAGGGGGVTNISSIS